MKNQYVIFIDGRDEIKPGSFLQSISGDIITYTMNVFDAEKFSNKKEAIKTAKRFDTFLDGNVYVLSVVKNITESR